jgi:hypothetical protein
MSHRDWNGWDEEGRRGRRGPGDRRNRTPIESIIFGSACTLVFGGLLLTRAGSGEWWWAFPMMFAGVMPLLGGLARLLTKPREAKTTAQQKEMEAEKQILRAAEEQKGRITPAKAALRTSLTIKEAQGLLERMAKEGHAVMNVTRDGLIEFEFPEFLPSRKNLTPSESEDR